MSKKYVVVGDQPADSAKMSPDGTKKPSDEKMAASGVAMMHPSAPEESTGNNMEERNKGKHTVTKGNYADMTKAEHLAAMKSSLDAFYMDKTIYDIAKAVWPDKQPMDWNMDEKCFAFHDGNVPASILSL